MIRFVKRRGEASSTARNTFPSKCLRKAIVRSVRKACSQAYRQKQDWEKGV